MNEWNSFFDGLIHGGEKVAQGIITKNLRNDAYDLYKNANSSLNQFLTGGEQNNNQNRVQPTQAENNINPITNNGNQVGVGLNMPMGNIQAPQISTQPDTSTSKGLFDYLNTVQETNALLGQYGDIGKPYQDALSNQFNTLLAQVNKKPDIREVNGQLVERQSDGTYSVKFGDKKKDIQVDISKPDVYMENGEYFVTYPYIDKNELKSGNTPKEKISKEKYDSIIGDKYLTAQQKSDIIQGRQESLMQFKLDLGLGNKGSKGNGAMTFDINKAEDYSRLKRFNELSRDYANIKNDDAKLTEYKALQKELTGKLNLDWQGLNGVVEKVGNMTDKQAKNFFKQLTEGKVDVKSNVQKQAEDIQTAFNQLKEAYSGQELINQLLNYFSQIKGAIDPYVMTQIKEQLKKNYNVELK